VNGGSGDFRSWSSRWVPITSDGAGNHIVVDHRPDEAPGSVFLADLQNGPMRHRGWPSLTDMIDSLCVALEQNALVDGHSAKITEDGGLAWEVVFHPE